MKKITTLLLLLLLFAATANAAQKWDVMKFTDNLSEELETLHSYCITHDVKLEDVLWANQIESQDIKSGLTIFLPANQADMLAIWQHSGAWKPTALVPVTSGAAARKLIEPQKTESPTTIQNQNNLPTTLPTTQNTQQIQTQTKTTETQKQNKTQIISQTPKTQKVQPQKPSNTETKKAIQNASKPDKILTAKPKPQKQELAGLMDPIIILSPNGDASQGPMRLIISGDKVEVVKLPQNAVPKRPSMADLDHTFGTTPSYLPYYNMTTTAKNNSIITNLNNLNGKMMWPVDGKISSYFGIRGKRKHQGIDIPMPAGTPIRAAKNGVVARTGNNSTIGFRGYGNFVMLDHGGNLRTFYAHCSSVAVVEGQRIMQGQIIAYVGNTGRSTANHLHFEVRVNNVQVNPIPYLAGNSHLASHK